MEKDQLFSMVQAILVRVEDIASTLSKTTAGVENNTAHILGLKAEQVALERRVATLEAQRAALMGIIIGIILASAGGGMVLAKLLLP